MGNFQIPRAREASVAAPRAGPEERHRGSSFLDFSCGAPYVSRMAPTLWLLFLLVALPVVMFVARQQRLSLAATVVFLSALFGLLRPPAIGPTLSPWLLDFLLVFLLFRLGGRVHLEDLRHLHTLLWTLGFLLASVALALVFQGIPLFRPHAVPLALILQAGAPVALLAFLHEDRPHGTAVRLATLGTYVHLSLVFLFLFSFQGPGVGHALERFLVYLLVSGSVGAGLGLVFAYLEAKVAEDFYLLLLVVGTLAFLEGLFGLLHLSAALPVMVAGVVAANTSLKNRHLWHILAPYEYPLVLLFLGLVFFEVHRAPWPQMAWGILGVLLLAGTLRGLATLGLFRPRRPHIAGSLALFATAQAAVPLWLAHRWLPGFHALDLPLALTAITGYFLWKRAFAAERSLVLQPPLETLWAPETATLVHKLLRLLRRPRASQELRANDFLRTTYRTVSSEATLEQVVQTLLKAQAHAVPVVDEQRRLLGIVRSQDLEHLFADEQTRHLIRAIDVMVPYGGLSPDTPAPRILDQMNQLATDCLPVTSEGKLLGVVLKRDLLTKHV